MDVSSYRNLFYDFFSCRIINIVRKDDKNNIDEIVNFTHIMEELLEWNNNTVDFISEKSFLVKLEEIRFEEKDEELILCLKNTIEGERTLLEKC